MRFTLLSIVVSSAQTAHANAQQNTHVDAGLSKVKAMFAQRERKALEQPFIGVKSSVSIEENLFKIQATGVSTKPIVEAANKFLSSMTSEQRSLAQFPVDDIEWRKWSNVDNGIYHRQGVSLSAMNAEQKASAFGLMNASLSARGLKQSTDIMKTDQTLKELNNNASYLDEQLYFFTIMGKPSTTEPWGWQVDGHHLVINFFVLGSQIVMSPVFMGAEPVVTTSGKYKGNVVLQKEQNRGLALMLSLSKKQQHQALLGKKNKTDMVAAANQDNLTLEYQGVNVASFNKQQKAKLLQVVEQYVGKISTEHAKINMAQIQQYLDQTWFAFKGGHSENDAFYYRIHSPVVLIEFDHQAPIAVDSPDGSDKATKNHIHTMLRTPNGNDYGKDLLKQHLHEHHQ